MPLQLQACEKQICKTGIYRPRNLLGANYLAKSIMMIDAQAPVADRSAYTAIVVGRMWLGDGPTLVVKSDYAATDLPVPAGLGGTQTTLVE